MQRRAILCDLRTHSILSFKADALARLALGRNALGRNCRFGSDVFVTNCEGPLAIYDAQGSALITDYRLLLRRIGSGSALELLWDCSGCEWTEVARKLLVIARKLLRNCSGTALKLLWNCTGTRVWEWVVQGRKAVQTERPFPRPRCNVGDCGSSDVTGPGTSLGRG